jgi:hypothetical protein
MPARLLFTIVFIEGYCSLGAEIIALRTTDSPCRQFDRGDGADHRLLPSGAGAGLPLRQPRRRELPRGGGAQLPDLGG